MFIILLFISISLQFAFVPEPNLYLSTQKIYDQFNQLAKIYPKVMKMHTCENDKKIQSIELNGVNSSLNSAIIVCGIHARELITVQTCLKLVQKFLRNQQLLEKFHLEVFPVANLERNNVLTGKYCERRNSKGVDMNRNFPINFRFTVHNPRDERYGGEKPLSQTFTECIDKKLSSRQWDIFIDVHSGQFSIYESSNSLRRNSKQIKQISAKLKKIYCPACRILNQNDRQYAGQLFQYAAQKYNVPYSFALEIYGGSIAVSKQTDKCFKIFNPNFIQSRDHYTNIWSDGILHIFSMVNKIKRGSDGLQK